MFVEGSSVRALFADPARPTDAEKLKAFDSFAGHTGSYTVQESVIQMSVIVAKSPMMMGSDMINSFVRFTYRIASDTLRLTRRSPVGTVILKLVRVE